jgi:hypothetical protein
MALNLSNLRKPLNRQVVDPSTGLMRPEWDLYFQDLTGQLNSAVGELGNDPAPIDAEYIVGAANGTLTAERVATNSTSVTWNLGVSGQAALERAALTGDVTASSNSNATTIANNAVITAKIINDAVTFAKMQDIATDSLIGRDTAGTGDPENITLNTTLSMTGAGALQRAALTGDVTATAGSNATVIANDAVTYAKIQDVSATSRILGRRTAGSGDVEECTLSQILDFIGSAAQGDILYRGSASWSRLGAGSNRQFLQTQGAAADVQWANGGSVLLTSGTVTNAATLDIVLT